MLYEGGWFSIKELAENRGWNKTASTRISHRTYFKNRKWKMSQDSHIQPLYNGLTVICFYL